MIKTREVFTSISSCTTLLNKTGSWRTQRPVFEAQIAPCQSACPAGSNVPEWLDLVKDGDLQKAWEVIVETNPLVFTCGCVCPRFCEAQCNRGKFDEALSIRSIERFLGEEAVRNDWHPPKAVHSQKGEVAIIGAGPAGLSCAYQLGRRGYNIAIFEASPVIGGMLQLGIQDYRLPRNILEIEISNNILSPFKVEVRTNCSVSQELFERIKHEFQAVFVASGAHKGKELKVPGTHLDGVSYGVDFLRERATDKLPPDLFKGKKILIIGGGGVAIDAARSALRLGAREAKLVCLESREEIPAYEQDLQDALTEGVEIDYSWGPEELLGDGEGKVKEVNLVRCTAVFDSRGKFSPSFDSSARKSYQVDAVIIATGQVSDLSFLNKSVHLAPEAKVKVDDVLRTDVAGVFAGGDAVTQPATVIEAIASGRKAAFSIDSYLRGEPFIPEEELGRVVRFEELNLDYLRHQPRQGQVHNRLAAVEEAKRCFSCGHCNLCGNCWAFCPDMAVRLGEKHCEISYDYCKGCGICVEECPTKSLCLKKE